MTPNSNLSYKLKNILWNPNVDSYFWLFEKLIFIFFATFYIFNIKLPLLPEWLMIFPDAQAQLKAGY